MTTSDVMKAAKSAQVRESVDRGGRSPDAQNNRDMAAAAMDVADDTNVPVDDVAPVIEQRQPSDGAQEPPKERQLSPMEQRRADIISGFRKNRATEDTDADADAKDIRRLTRDGLPPEMVQMEAQDNVEQVIDEGTLGDELDKVEAAEQSQTPTETPPAKVKMKVRGKEIEVTQDELLAFAQKGAAGDDYLTEAKTTLEEVKRLQRDLGTKGAPQPGKHPAEAQATESDTEATQQAEGDEHHVDPFVKTAETVQLGTPEEAALELRKTVQDTARGAAREALESERLRDESARSSRFLKDFQDKNQDLAADRLAHAAIERTLYDLQVEDIKALGVDDNQLPKTPTDIANWHLWYRANGYKVRNIPELLNTARDEVMAWKGVKAPAKTETDEPAKRKAEPRVEVTVDRAQRRAAIPQQPSRTATSQQAPTTTQPAQPRDRSDVVQQMIAARAKPRGKTMGV